MQRKSSFQGPASDNTHLQSPPQKLHGLLRNNHISKEKSPRFSENHASLPPSSLTLDPSQLALNSRGKETQLCGSLRPHCPCPDPAIPARPHQCPQAGYRAAPRQVTPPASCGGPPGTPHTAQGGRGWGVGHESCTGAVPQPWQASSEGYVSLCITCQFRSGLAAR